MKKRLSIIIIIGLLITTVAFLGLWQYEKRSQADIEALCRSGAVSALTFFKSFQEHGYESDYFYAVAEFKVFEDAYHLLTEGTNKATNYIFCNEVYGYLVLCPEHSQKHIDDIIDVMEILAEDYSNENGFLKMSALRNTLNPSRA